MYYQFILAFFQCYIFLLVDASTITVDPQDTDVVEGGNVILYCTVDGLGGNTVIWNIVGTSVVFSRNRTIVDSSVQNRYKIIGNDTEGIFNLQITGVSASFESGRSYQCSIDNGVSFVRSDAAILNVHKEPTLPTCNVDSDTTQAGDNITFTCVFDSLIPNVEMNLTKNSKTLLNEIVDPDLSTESSTSSTSFIAAAEDDGAVLRCSVDNQLFIKPYECFKALNVKHEPIVEIVQNGMLPYGNASFTCGAVSNPDATQFKWSLCLDDTGMECLDQGEGTLTLEQDDSEEGLPIECEVFGSNVSCLMFKNGETEVPVYVILIDDNLTIPENTTVTPCLLECLVMNAIGEGIDTFTIDNTICVMAIEPTTTIMSTTFNPTTMLSTTMSPPTSAPTTSGGVKTTAALGGETDTNTEIKDYYYIIGGLAGGTVVLFVITIVILLYRKSKSDPDEDTTVTATQWTHYQNTGYDDNGGFEEEPKDDKILYTPDNPFKTFGKGNETESSPHEYDNIHDKNTLPVNGDNTRLEPEGEVNQEEALPEANVDAVDHSGVNDHVENGSNGDVAINMNDDPQYAVVNKSSFRNEPKSETSLDNVDGVEYTDSNPYYEVNYEKRPSVTQI